MTSKVANALASCVTSPYLLQHAYNPVHWMPWGPKAHQLAKELQKPIFLSIGYTSCHWCHVMERESFENEEIATQLNEYFVNIKVDKEERPDVDRIYMNYVQATTGSGGWPLSLFLTPDLKPFVGGTYFPPEEKFGQIGFKALIRRIHQIWIEDAPTIVTKSSHMFNMLKSTLSGQGNNQDEALPVPAQTLNEIALRIYQQFSKRFDREYGGFSEAPKFPRPAEMQCLLALASARVLDGSAARHSLEMVLHTLKKMSQGGIHDHIGGGFARYSVDELWHIPHFEKMLYDNAQMLQCYAAAFQVTRDPFYARMGCDIFDYIVRDMSHSNGAFYSAQDADSRPNLQATESKEGAYYVLTRKEVLEQLPGPIGEIFCAHYNIKENGNCNMSARSDPNGDFRGFNVPIELGREPILSTARHFQRDATQIRDALKEARWKLLRYRRSTRPPPILDDKIISAWNAMMISACARCHLAFTLGADDDAETRDFLSVGEKAMASLKRDLFAISDDGSRQLLRSVRYVSSGDSSTPEECVQGSFAFADDYAWMIAANLDLYEATANQQYLQDALALQDDMDRKFRCGNSYLSGDPRDDPSVLVQIAEMNDGAEPSPNSVAVGNLFRLRQIVDDDIGRRYADMANAIWFWAHRAASELPTTVPLLVANSLVYTSGADRIVKIIIAAATPLDSPIKEYRQRIYSRYLPALSVLYVTSPDARDYLAKWNRTVRGLSWPPDERRAVVYLCAGWTCLPPMTDPSTLADQLDTVTLKPTDSTDSTT